MKIMFNKKTHPFRVGNGLEHGFYKKAHTFGMCKVVYFIFIPYTHRRCEIHIFILYTHQRCVTFYRKRIPPQHPPRRVWG